MADQMMQSWSANVAGLLLDCDGVLVDSERMSCGAWNPVFSRHFSVDIGNDYSPILGTSADDTIRHFASRFSLDIPADLAESLKAEKEAEYVRMSSGHLMAFAGVEELLRWARVSSWPMVVASSGSRAKILHNLKESRLLPLLEGVPVVSASEVKRGKPEPDLFLEAKSRIASLLLAGSDELMFIVVEDSVHGVVAGKRAGCHVIAVANTFPAADLAAAGADYVAADMHDVLDRLRLLFRAPTD